MEKDLIPLEILKSQLWQMIEVLRTEQISPDEYHIILFLMILHKDNLLDVNYQGDVWERKDQLIENIEGTLLEHNETLEDIYDNIYKLIIERLGALGYASLIQHLAHVDKPLFDKFFPDLFDDILWKIIKAQGRFSGQYYVSKEINRFASSIVEIPLDAKVYNPFAGIGSFNYFLPSHAKFYGQELVYQTWALATLRIFAHDKWESSDFRLGDSINRWNPFMDVDHPDYNGFYQVETQLKYDLIISNPPFGLRLNNPFQTNLGSIRNAEHLIIENGLEDLTPNGKIVLFIPQSFLSSLSNKRLRQHLVENDLLETVISFPGGLLSNTSMAFAIIVLSNNKQFKGLVQFVNAEKFVEIQSRSERKLNDLALISELRNPTKSSVIKLASNDTIRANEFNLLIPRYFKKHHEGVLLSTLGSIIPGQRVNGDVTGKLVRIRDLSDGVIDVRLDLKDIESLSIPRHCRKIEESCVIFAIRWRSLKPTYFEHQGTPIYLTPDTIAFKVDESTVDVGYLINELKADYVNDQIESYRSGEIIPNLRRDDLLQLKITLPSLEEQRAKLAGLREGMVKMKLVEAERNALAHGMGNLVYENFASVKHSLGKPLLNIGSSLRNIEKALSKLDKEWASLKLSERQDVTLKDSFVSLYSNLDLIHSLLKNNEREFDVSNYDLSTVDFLKFIKAYVKKIKSAEKSNVEISLDINPDLSQHFGKNLFVNANTELLDIALNNIVDNANRHAFIESSKKYKLYFRLSLQLGPSVKSKTDEMTSRSQSYLKVEVANNGVPFPENFTLEKFIRKNTFAGNTGNTGIGGSDINEIVKRHNEGKSTLDLITTDFTTEFVTTYIFLIPISN